MPATRPAIPAYRRTAEAVLADLGGDPRRGLPAAEIPLRLARVGRNELPAPPRVPAWRRFVAQFGDALTLLLLAATAVSLVAWWLEQESPVPYEALTILAIVLVDAVLGFVQERRAEQAVAALEAMAAPTARVLRDGEPAIVPAAEVVPGDLLLLEEGDTIAADARVIESIALQTAEAALTGESTPVSKDAAPAAAEAGIADRSGMVFSGSAIASGRGRAVVTATGPATELGAIARSLQATEKAETPLQRELDGVGKGLGIAVIAIAVVIGVTILVAEHVRSPAGLLDVLLLAVSLAVAAVPEGLTAVTTIVLSLGTQRMARRNVIVRELAAVETLGSTTTICSDKTGTLTRNEMTVRTVITASGRVEVTGTGYQPSGELLHDGAPVGDPALREELERTLTGAALASNATLLEREGRWVVEGDPTEGALLVAARKAGLSGEALERRYPRLGEVPFSASRKRMTTAHGDAERTERLIVFSKGAPDLLLARCAAERLGPGTRPLTPARREELLGAVDTLAASALRTLGVAYRILPRAPLEGGLGEEVEEAMVFLGVVGMIDPPRPEARAAVAVARRAGVRPVLITGDHPGTAAAVAAEVGIAARADPAVDGAELDRLDDGALRDVVRRVAVYARVAPEHKLRIVRALQANGEVVAMTGDGVNDAPALKAADIGVAMGVTGTDVARGAADMILADDDFASIVAAVEEGRSIFANVQRFLRYLLSSNLGEVLVMFLGVVGAGALGLLGAGGEGSAVVAPLLATQILWVNLLTDAAPALALGVEPADPGVMLAPPRDPRSRVIGGRTWLDLVWVGVVMAAGTLLVMDWALPGGLVGASPSAAGLGRARTLAFTTLVLFQLFNAFNARSADRSAFHRPFANRWLWGAVLLSLLLQVAVVHLPPLQRAFSTVPLALGDWLACAAVASSVLWLMELRKLLATRLRGAASGPR